MKNQAAIQVSPKKDGEKMLDAEIKDDRIGDRLKAARKKKSMSQEDVSKKLLISRQSISKWENNICLPDLENFKKICELYEIDTSELLVQSESTIEREDNRQEAPADIIDVPYLNGISEQLKETQIETENINELNTKYFLIPFYWLYFLKKGLYKIDFSKRIIVLMLLNIILSIGVAYLVYCGVPKTTSIPSGL